MKEIDYWLINVWKVNFLYALLSAMLLSGILNLGTRWKSEPVAGFTRRSLYPPKKIPLRSTLILRPSFVPENMSVNKKEYIASDIPLRMNGLK
jgi:hypothetical protein